MQPDIDNKSGARINLPIQLDPDAVDRFYADLQRLLQTGVQQVHLLCSKVRAVQSTHIAVLWSAREMCETAAARLIITDATPNLVRTIQVLDLEGLFEYEGETLHRDEDLAPPQPADYGSAALALTFEPTSEAIGAAQREFLDFLMRLELPQMDRFDLQTAFYEIVTNIRLHGRLPEGEEIEFKAEPADTRITMTFRDRGLAFDPVAAQSDLNVIEAARQRKTRGFGLSMIGRLADRMAYDRTTDGINVLTVTKKRGRHE